MTRRIGQKLNSGAGMTMLFALVGFMMAAMASFTIVTVSLNNIARVGDQQREQRDYLAVTSAAALLRDSLKGGYVSIHEEFAESGALIGSPSYAAYGVGSDGLAVALVKSMYQSGVMGEIGELTIQAGSELGDVKAVIDYNASGTLSAKLHLASEDGTTAPVTVSFSGLHPVLIRDEIIYRTDDEGNVYFVSHTRDQQVNFAENAFHVAAGWQKGGNTDAAQSG